MKCSFLKYAGIDLIYRRLIHFVHKIVDCVCLPIWYSKEHVYESFFGYIVNNVAEIFLLPGYAEDTRFKTIFISRQQVMLH